VAAPPTRKVVSRVRISSGTSEEVVIPPPAVPIVTVEPALLRRPTRVASRSPPLRSRRHVGLCAWRALPEGHGPNPGCPDPSARSRRGPGGRRRSSPAPPWSRPAAEPASPQRACERTLRPPRSKRNGARPSCTLGSIMGCRRFMGRPVTVPVLCPFMGQSRRSKTKPRGPNSAWLLDPLCWLRRAFRLCACPCESPAPAAAGVGRLAGLLCRRLVWLQTCTEQKARLRIRYRCSLPVAPPQKSIAHLPVRP
jgi:hypothetical protein